MFKSLLVKVVNLYGAIAAILLLFGFLAPWLAIADSFAHFRLHLTLVVLIAALAHLIWRNWREVAAGAAVSALGIIGMSPAIPFWSAPQAGAMAPAITLVQLNLSFRNRTPQAVADFVRAERADIVTLQEVTGKTGRVIELLAKDYPHHVRCPFGRGVGGVAVLSRLPRAKGASDGCAPGKGMAWLRVMVEGRPVSFATLHLHWPYPFRQWSHIASLEQPMRDIPRPVVLAGDFNAAPWSHAVAQVEEATGADIAEGLRFSFDINFRGVPAKLPIPIDHVLAPPELTVTEARVGPGPGSDHRSIVARLAFSGLGNTEQAQAPVITETANAN